MRLTPEEIKARLDYQAFYRAELADLRPGTNGNALGICPLHDDRKPSFSVNLTTGLWQCFACQARGDIIDFYMKKYGYDFHTALRELARFAGLDPDEARPEEGEGSGLTLEQFAAAKKLPVDFLQACGVREVRGQDGRPYLVFEYRDLDGQPMPGATRMRFSMAERPRARRGGKPEAFGLWKLREALAEDGELLILEGESDTLTAWYYGLPALGLPGKGMTRLLDPTTLDGFRSIYVWQEPDAQDFPVNVAKALPGFRVLRMVPPEGVKDLSEAHCRGLDVLALVRRMQQEAQEVSMGDTDHADGGGPDAREKTISLLIKRCKKHAN